MALLVLNVIPNLPTNAPAGARDSYNLWQYLVWATIKSSIEYEVSYSFPMQYGGDVIVRATELSGMERKSSMQSPLKTTDGVLSLHARMAGPTEL